MKNCGAQIRANLGWKDGRLKDMDDTIKHSEGMISQTLPYRNLLTISLFSGPRTCLGQGLVLTQISYTLVRLLQEFKNIESKD